MSCANSFTTDSSSQLTCTLWRAALFLSLLIGCGPLWGQHDERSVVHWSDGMSRPDVSLQESQRQFNAYFESNEKGRSRGIKPFERWSHWQTHQGALQQSAPLGGWWKASEVMRSQWQPAVDGGEGWTYLGPVNVPIHGGAGRINRIKLSPNDPSVWFACAPSGGLWRTHDAGTTWQVFGADVVAPLGATDVWVDPDNEAHIWLCTGDGNGGDTYSIGVLESWDGGLSWDPLPVQFEPNQGRRIHAIQTHPENQDIRWVCTDIGILGTQDGGTEFEVVLPGAVRDVVWVGESEAVAAIENVGLTRTSDGGLTWVNIPLPSTDNSVGRIQVAGQTWSTGTDSSAGRDTLYAVAGHYFQQNFLAFWRSTDRGLTWEAMATKLSGPNLLGYAINGADNGGQAFWDLCIAVDPQNAKRVLVGGVNVWETMDGGMTWNCPLHWQGAYEAKYTHADQHDLRFHPDGSVLLANDGGVFRWYGDHVEDLSDGLNIAQGYHVATHPTEPLSWLLGTQDNGTMLSSAAYDARILDGDGMQCFFDPNVPNRLYASAYYGMLYRSDDGGRTMNNIATYFFSGGPNEIGAWETPFMAHPAVPGRIVAAKKSIHMSDDGGLTWSSLGGLGSVRSTVLTLSQTNPDFYLVAKNHVLYLKSNVQDDFQQVDGMPGAQIGDVILGDSDSQWWVAFETYNAGEQVWFTPDGGSTWQNRSAGLPALPIHDLAFLSTGMLVCGSDVGVHAWSEEQQSWDVLGDGLPLVPVVEMDEQEGAHRLVVSTYGRGIWSMLLPDRPELDVAMATIDAPQTQCMFSLEGTPVALNVGQTTLTELSWHLSVVGEDWSHEEEYVTTFADPWMPGELRSLSTFQLEVPHAGEYQIVVHAQGLSDNATAFSASRSMLASGLGHVTTLTWWGDCENADMRWELVREDGQDIVTLGAPLSPGDTVSTSWCLTEGCHSLVWNDLGGDGFSGSYCGETGGYTLQGPFGEVIDQAYGLDFGSQLEVSFCVEVPWCFADYNGDGHRGVDDLLMLLSEFGCLQNCPADNDLDDLVGVGDLMNMLSVFSLGCLEGD
ncbi:MAG: hypothetical protein O3B70_00390 [Bacteroidetes bacterium]|nr:hypothetical protein [Bacteroidota bacterium]MDA0902773.1 hypothetical protein [Bacteroidota bacterium]MDA1242910.1 hypothetical protein [Bacteroidota bacterium]